MWKLKHSLIYHFKVVWLGKNLWNFLPQWLELLVIFCDTTPPKPSCTNFQGKSGNPFQKFTSSVWSIKFDPHPKWIYHQWILRIPGAQDVGTSSTIMLGGLCWVPSKEMEHGQYGNFWWEFLECTKASSGSCFRVVSFRNQCGDQLLDVTFVGIVKTSPR